MNYSLNAFAQPLTASQAAHLLRRASFGPSQSNITAFTGVSSTLAIQTLIDNIALNPTPAPVDLDSSKATAGQQYVNVNYDGTRNFDFRFYYKYWWLNIMATQNNNPSILDKLTLFWQNHFVTTEEVVDEYRVIHQYFMLIRNGILGNFKEFVRDISKNPAMLKYLNGNENVKGYSDIVKLYLKENYKVKDIFVEVKPIIKSRFRKLQETGLEAELYFMNNYNTIETFKGGILEDARLYGDGYDFQMNVNESSFLAEIKGIREKKGRFRMTEKEYKMASEYKSDYFITLVLNMNDLPSFLTIENPVNNLKFKKEERVTKPIIEYHLMDEIC